MKDLVLNTLLKAAYGAIASVLLWLLEAVKAYDLPSSAGQTEKWLWNSVVLGGLLAIVALVKRIAVGKSTF